MAREAAKVAAVGTGIVVPAMANLSRAGFEVRTGNAARRPNQSPRMTSPCILAAAAIEEVLSGGVLPALPEGAVRLRMSTAGIEGCGRLADVAGAAGVLYVDAPVTGAKQPAIPVR